MEEAAGGGGLWGGDEGEGAFGAADEGAEGGGFGGDSGRGGVAVEDDGVDQVADSDAGGEGEDLGVGDEGEEEEGEEGEEVHFGRVV